MDAAAAVDPNVGDVAAVAEPKSDEAVVLAVVPNGDGAVLAAPNILDVGGVAPNEGAVDPKVVVEPNVGGVL